jgi:hypothetical protein
VFPDVKEVEMLEIVESAEVKKQQYGDDFAFRHFHRAVSALFTVSRPDLEFFVFDGKFFAKIVHNTENLFMHVFLIMVFMIRFA